MKFVIKLFPEISMKSKSIRTRFTRILQCNIHIVLQRFDKTAQVQLFWDKLEVSSHNASPENHARMIAALACIPGIQTILEVKLSQFTDMEDIARQTQAVWGDKIVGKTFCVRVRRLGKHEFSSFELERHVGGALYDNCDTGGARMKLPDVQINLEIEGKRLYIVSAAHVGLGGFPVATQEDVLCLISGGFDSGLAAYQFIKRGCRVHYCFFNLGGAAHESGVKQVSYFLWNKYGSSHQVRFTAIDFAPVVAEILEKIDGAQMGVVLKRMMMRAADKLARQYEIPALVTGESVGQVASQTLSNLNVIDSVSQTVILRPLITWDKPDIIDQTRRIGSAVFAETMPEYCGVISKKPTIKAVPHKVEAEEAKFDFSILQRVVESAHTQDIRKFAATAADAGTGMQAAEIVAIPAPHDVVIDIRAPDDEELNPLRLDQIVPLLIPFYKLASQFAALDQEKTYLLYCERGVMSALQAHHLQEQGYSNVKVLRR